jgi:adenylate cyclase
VTVTVGGKSLVLGVAPQEPPAPADELESLAGSSLCPTGDAGASIRRAQAAIARIGEGTLQAEELMQWMQAALGVLQGAAGSTESFFPLAAQSLVNLVGLDFGCVLLRENDRWVVHKDSRARQAEATSGLIATGGEPAGWQPSQQVLNRVYQEKKTFWQKPGATLAGASLVGVQAVVASPILSGRGEVIGVLYGEQRRAGSGGQSINRLLAMLVEVLAGGVAAGISRLEQEHAALRNRFRWEQFVTPELARHLEDPDQLKGRDADVTMLSCDIRGFSRICSNLGPARTLEWVQDCLGTLSRHVLAEEGVLVDYVGDELLAMWGAPANQPDHAERACRAALEMLASVSLLNAKWKATVRETMGVSIGISSGSARVGNIGSAVKFKYGALGTTVNLASRVQGATKYLNVPILLTGAVRDRLGPAFLTRALCQVRVVNIPEVVALCQLTAGGHPGWDDLKRGYEQALSHFEQQEFRLAARVLGALLAQPAYRDDFPSLVLMQRAVTCMVDPPVQFSPQWELPGKGK